MISVSSIVPLIGGFAALALAAIGMSVPDRGGARTAYVLLASATALWGFAQFTLTSFDSLAHPLAGGNRPEALAAAVLLMIALTAAVVYWVVFACAYSGCARCASLPALALAAVPALAIGLTAASNPGKHLLSSATAGSSPPEWTTYTFAFVIACITGIAVGSAVLTRTLIANGDPHERWAALAIIVLTGVFVVWGVRFTAGGLSGRHLDYTAVPALFTVLMAIPVLPITRRSTAAVPTATTETFDVMTDVVLVLDRHLRLAAMNLAALSLFPGLKKGRDIASVCGEIARHARFCVDYACDDLAFEARIDGSVFWGRARRSLDRSGVCDGVVVLLSDLARLRDMQTTLIEQGVSADGDAVGKDYLEWLGLTRSGGRPG